MSLVKYRLREVAADFGVTPKEVSEILGTYFEKPKSNTQVLTEEQLNVVFDRMTAKHPISSLEVVFSVPATVDKAEEKKPEAPKAEQKKSEPAKTEDKSEEAE